jgi:acetyl-CoA acyltransferase
MVSSVFVVDACRTPIGKVKGALAGVRPDHLAADVIRALVERNPALDVAAIDDVYWGAANQAGEDNRNVARMAVLLAGLPVEIPGATVNRLCGSGMEAVSDAARAIAAGEADICLAGGSESMTRAPFVVARSADPFPRALDLADTRSSTRRSHWARPRRTWRTSTASPGNARTSGRCAATSWPPLPATPGGSTPRSCP